METAIVVPLEGLAANPVTRDPIDLELLFAQWAVRGAQSAPGMPLHVTLLTPFVDHASLATGMFDQIQAVLSMWQPFDCNLGSIQIFPGSPRIAWIDPEPHEPFVEMTRALMTAFPGYLPYSGEHGSAITPHVTIAKELEGVDFPGLLELIASDLPIRTTVRRFSVFRLNGDRWELLATRSLGIRS